ncbi:coiled-coil domain-containing protein 127-like protein [Lates japonicus]|uniref:Coiled-coil domain-containing protein 127-like protein n=1 Tax=Lates japonicus TaxID=270547 RepID=A0AAD3NCV4_LATJO|nr:coiled-coil domain-containing protein 127-like protein [Lates japonicus]
MPDSISSLAKDLDGDPGGCLHSPYHPQRANMNMEGGEGGGGGGGGWLAAGVTAAVLCWQIHNLKTKTTAVEVKIREHSDFITDSKLKELEDLLVERQHIYCSNVKPKSRREQLEDQIRKIDSEFKPHTDNLRVSLNKVLTKDDHCGSEFLFLMTGDKRGNGKLMWEYLNELKMRVKQ